METGQEHTFGHSLESRLFEFAQELTRRRVWRTALAYGAVVFVLLQMGEIVFPAFGAPAWALRVLVVSCFLACPVVLCLAWIFDITPRGIRKTLGVPHSDGEPSAVGRALPRLALLAVTLAVMGGLGWWTVRDTIGSSGESLAGGQPVPATAVGSRPDASQVRSLAVLPLDDFSEESGGGHFTAGLHEEIISQLSSADFTSVISRTSVVQYDRSGKTMPIIARELGAQGVLEGSVFRSGNRVRVTVQLIHGPTDTHLWANSYEGTLEDAIELQRQVAEAITREIREKVTGEPTDAPATFRLARTEEGKIQGPAPATDSLTQIQGASPSSFSRTRPQAPGLDSSPEGRLDGARRLAASAHFGEAEEVLEEVLNEVEASEEAWATLEQIRAQRGDLEGVVRLRADRLSFAPSDAGDSTSFRELRTLIREKGDEGYWIWKSSELEGRIREGEEVSPILLARAYVGVGDLEGAYPLLEAAVEDGDPSLVSLWTDPAWEALRPDPRFQAILLKARRAHPGGSHLPLPDGLRPGP